MKLLYSDNDDEVWPAFLKFLQVMCDSYGWQIEYEDTNDYSVAIFANDEVSAYQLPLFSDYSRSILPRQRIPDDDLNVRGRANGLLEP